MGENSYRPRSRLLAAAAVVGLAAALTACGTEPDNDFTLAEPPPPPASEPGDATPQIASPADGEVVSLPFDVAVDTDAELGAIEDGLHHLHIWFDEEDFGLYEAATATITGEDQPVPDGETTMFVQLHTAEHDPVGEVVSISLTVEGGTDPADDADDADDPGDSDPDDTGGDEDGGSGYGY